MTRREGELSVDYLLDYQPIAHVDNVGIPLDRQGVLFSGIYPSAGAGELLADQLDSVRIGHGIFSLLDAFPFQHPAAPQLSVSIPAKSTASPGDAGRARLFGQGARGSFDNFTTMTIPGSGEPTNLSELVTALAAARR